MEQKPFKDRYGSTFYVAAYPSTTYSLDYVAQITGGDLTPRAIREFLLKKFEVLPDQDFDFAFLMGDWNFYHFSSILNDEPNLATILLGPESKGRVMFSRYQKNKPTNRNPLPEKNGLRIPDPQVTLGGYANTNNLRGDYSDYKK